MTTPDPVLSYLQVLAWPVIAIFALIILIIYRRVIESLLSQSKITFRFGGVSIETTLEKLERSIEENLRGRKLSAKQWAWLTLLRDKERVDYNNSRDYAILVPLRNAGLITQYQGVHPVDQLTIATEVGITTLGKLLLEAWEQSPKRLLSIEYYLALQKLTKEKEPVKPAKAA